MTQKKQHTSKSGWGAAILVVIIIIAVFLYIGSKSSSSPYAGSSGSSVSSTVPQVQNLVLVHQGTVFSINPGNYDIVNFTVPSGAYSVSLTGSYTSQGKIEAAILTPTQYGMFTQNPSTISSSQYYYGDTQGSTIDASLSPGTYTLVFYDPGIITQDTVTVINPIVLTYTQ